MRPNSIIMFERLFLASLALGLVGFALSYEAAVAQLASDPALRQLGVGGGLLVGATAVGYAIYLLLWYLIARRASIIAKWILVVFTAFGVLAALPSLAGPLGIATIVSLAIYALEIAAIVYLFKSDAKDWFAGQGEPGPDTLD